MLRPARLFRLNHAPWTVAGILHCGRAFYTTAEASTRRATTGSQSQTQGDRPQQTATTMPEIVDDKSEHCIPFVLDRVKAHQSRYGASDAQDVPPLFLGLNGVQGAGKTVLVSRLQSTLRSPPYSLPVVTLSLDDLYLTNADQRALAQTHPSNPLLQHRGQPSTHDLALGQAVFASLRAGRPTAIPQYDKAAFAGQGDRVSRDHWETVNQEGRDPVKVVVFEGWCVGFRAWDDHTLRAKWEAAVRAKNEDPAYKGRLGHVRLEDVQAVNDALRGYDTLTEYVLLALSIERERERDLLKLWEC